MQLDVQFLKITPRAVLAFARANLINHNGLCTSIAKPNGSFFYIFWSTALTSRLKSWLDVITFGGNGYSIWVACTNTYAQLDPRLLTVVATLYRDHLFISFITAAISWRKGRLEQLKSKDEQPYFCQTIILPHYLSGKKDASLAYVPSQRMFEISTRGSFSNSLSLEKTRRLTVDN